MVKLGADRYAASLGRYWDLVAVEESEEQIGRRVVEEDDVAAVDEMPGALMARVFSRTTRPIWMVDPGR
ncbi:unnamed protein product [Linum trigynum]